MAYETYTTEAIVCGTKNRNTADRSYLLFTREAGMLFADARSVREERSRQRYALQDFSLIRVSLVKGKAGWRIGSIEPQQNFYHDAIDKSARGSVVSVVRLLRRFLRGEEAQQALFDYTKHALQVLSAQTEARQFVELVVQVELLRQLGYVAAEQIPKQLQSIQPSEISDSYNQQNAKKIEQLYSQAVSVSHL
jgi:DNA repair protein RecO